MIKMVITDIDGTLVEDGSKTLPAELVDTIVKLLWRPAAVRRSVRNVFLNRSGSGFIMPPATGH